MTTLKAFGLTALLSLFLFATMYAMEHNDPMWLTSQTGTF